MHVRGTQITTTVFLKMISEVGISQGCKKRQGNCSQKWLPENLEKVYGAKGREVIRATSREQRKRMTRGWHRLNHKTPCIHLKNSL